MPNRILRDGILTSESVNAFCWDSSLPDPKSLATEDAVLAVRVSLPTCKAGDPLQAYKWALTMRLRAIRMRNAGALSQKLVRQLIADAGKECPVCFVEMNYSVERRWPTIDHVVALANGGSNAVNNLRVICNRCNSKKADRA